MLIGLTGKAGAGKDTVADILVKNHGFKKLAFADTLKRMLAVAGFPEPARELKEKIIPGFDFSWRDAAQKLGTEWGRSLDDNIWVKLTMLGVKNSRDNYVISDCRFENEAKAIRGSGTLVHIVGRQSVLEGATATHVSEGGVEAHTWDLWFDNSKPIESLEHRVGAFFGSKFHLEAHND